MKGLGCTHLAAPCDVVDCDWLGPGPVEVSLTRLGGGGTGGRRTWCPGLTDDADECGLM